jgi:RHS repeat-associated protein
VRSYTWNARNQLASLTGPVNGSFAYDGVGRRRSKTIGGTTTQFLYDGLNPVQELASGTPTANLLTGLGIDEHFTRTDSAGVRNYLADALGSSVALADGSGTVQTEYTYVPFGATSVTGASTTSPFGFTGRENDGTGLYYYRARYYHPIAQRFVSEDPLGFSAGDPNVHAYVFNSPTQHTDPTGRILPLVALCAAGAAGSAAADWLAGRKFDPIKAAGWCTFGVAAGLAAPAVAAAAGYGAGAGYGAAAGAAAAGVTYGHGARHASAAGISPAAVEAAITNQPDPKHGQERNATGRIIPGNGECWRDRFCLSRPHDRQGHPRRHLLSKMTTL